MRKPKSVAALDDLGRVRLSEHFFLREFLYSEIANLHGIPNVPDDPDLAIRAGRRLCEELLEPLRAAFGHVTVRSGYRAPAVNAFGNDMQRQGKAGYSCAANARTAANHIWDRLDADGGMGAMATVVIPWFIDRYDCPKDWHRLAWWIHDHLPYSEVAFYPKNCAFNLGWHERPKRVISSWIGGGNKVLTRPGMANHAGDHSAAYRRFPNVG